MSSMAMAVQTGDLSGSLGVRKGSSSLMRAVMVLIFITSKGLPLDEPGPLWHFWHRALRTSTGGGGQRLVVLGLDAQRRRDCGEQGQQADSGGSVHGSMSPGGESGLLRRVPGIAYCRGNESVPNIFPETSRDCKKNCRRGPAGKMFGSFSLTREAVLLIVVSGGRWRSPPPRNNPPPLSEGEP